MMGTRITVLIGLLGVVLVAGCGERRWGDPGGQPVTFIVELERPYVATVAKRTPRVAVGVGIGHHLHHSHHTHTGIGIGFHFRSTEIELVGGPNPGSAAFFAEELSWGRNTFTVPFNAGRNVALTVVVRGNRSGWEELSRFTVPDQPHTVHLRLDADGGRYLDGAAQHPEKQEAADADDGE